MHIGLAIENSVSIMALFVVKATWPRVRFAASNPCYSDRRQPPTEIHYRHRLLIRIVHFVIEMKQITFTCRVGYAPTVGMRQACSARLINDPRGTHR